MEAASWYEAARRRGDERDQLVEQLHAYSLSGDDADVLIGVAEGPHSGELVHQARRLSARHFIEDSVAGLPTTATVMEMGLDEDEARELIEWCVERHIDPTHD